MSLPISEIEIRSNGDVYCSDLHIGTVKLFSLSVTHEITGHWMHEDLVFEDMGYSRNFLKDQLET